MRGEIYSLRRGRGQMPSDMGPNDLHWLWGETLSRDSGAVLEGPGEFHNLYSRLMKS